MIGQGRFTTPPVVMNLLMINALMYLAQIALPGGWGQMVVDNGALYFWQSEHFRLYQLVSHMFLHGSFMHLFFNMFALWMFGRSIEYALGSKRFLIYYMVTGIGAGLLQMGVSWFEINHMTEGNPMLVEQLINTPMIGASGAVYGVLLAFGMIFPNVIIMLLIPPIPIKAKYFVIIYGLLELFLGVYSKGDSIAHFAHLGGMLWGFMLLMWWRKKRIQ